MSRLTGREIAEQVRQAAAEGLEEAAERVRARAAEEAPKTDPVRDPDPAATLAEDGRVEMSPGGGHARAVFDGPYAAKQHEAKHFEHPRGGKAKFLEDAVKEIVPELDGIVAGKVRARVKARRR